MCVLPTVLTASSCKTTEQPVHLASERQTEPEMKKIPRQRERDSDFEINEQLRAEGNGVFV